MIMIIDGDQQYPVNIDGKDWYVDHSYDGYDRLCFECSDTHEVYPYLAEETRVTDGNNLYTIKQIDDHAGYVSVTCPLDLDDWRERFWKSYRRTDSTLQQVFDDIKPSGWTLEGAAGLTKRGTIEASEGQGLENVIAEAILSRASEVYEVTFNFDVLNKTVRVIDLEGYTPSGDYLTDELNLRSIGFTGSTMDFATRLYAYGKKDNDGNPITIASVNGGKEYVDNMQYSSRIISAAWSDERYTSPQTLLEAAKAYLDTLSYPVRSYECDVRNLDGSMYMYKVVTLVDRKRRTRTDHRVIAYKEYPYAHYYDVVTLSAVPPKIEGTVKSISAEVDKKLSIVPQVSADAALAALQVITGAQGGHVKIRMENGLPEAIEITHLDGTKTIADSSGLFRGDSAYIHLVKSGVVEVDPVLGADVSIPELLGRDAEIQVGIRSVEPQSDTDVLQSISSACVWDKTTGTAHITADCNMLSVQTGIISSPKEIQMDYFIIGR